MNITLSHAGDDGSGKTTLMTKLQGVEHNKKGRGLEYLYLNVHDEDRDGKACRGAAQEWGNMGFKMG